MTKEKFGGEILRGKLGGLQCVCVYPDGKMERAMLLLRPVCHTSGQTHTILSVTCTCAITSISPMYILWKIKPVQEGVLSL